MRRSLLLIFCTVCTAYNELAADNIKRLCTAVAIGRKITFGGPASTHSVLYDTTFYGVFGSIKSHKRSILNKCLPPSRRIGVFLYVQFFGACRIVFAAHLPSFALGSLNASFLQQFCVLGVRHWIYTFLHQFIDEISHLLRSIGRLTLSRAILADLLREVVKV